MAQTVTKVLGAEDYAGAEVGGVMTSVGTCAGPDPYVEGGFGLTVSSFITGTVYDVKAEAPGYKCYWDHANTKLEVWYYDYSNAADGVAVEVPTASTTDLSNVTFRLLITHY